MHPCLILALLLSRFLATVSGQLLDRDGHPLPHARITYKYVGTVDKNLIMIPGMLVENPKMIERGGHTYNTRTDKKGAFTMVGLEYGVYDVDITGPDGTYLYSGRKIIGDPADASSQNVLNVDLSAAYKGPVEPGAGTNLAGGKKSKEQLKLIEQEKYNAEKINRLIVRYHMALGAQDTSAAIGLLEQLIALDGNRWEFYQNLGTLQSNQMHYQEAAESYARGVEVARKVLANPSDSDLALATLGDLLLAEADSYERMEKVDQAVALYDQAAAAYPHPFMAHYRACTALMNNGKTDAAIEKCSQAVADDPAQWEPYQTLGGIFTAANRSSDALEAYEKGVAAAQKTLQQQPGSQRARIGMGQMLNSEGNLLVQLKKYEDAIGAFARAAESSAYPAMPYFNLCATYYNLKRAQEALSACDHAISSDPRMADAYYIKALILFAQGRMEHGKYAVRPGTTEALNKYLELAPSGDRAGTVKDMINQISRPVDAPYQPVKK